MKKLIMSVLLASVLLLITACGDSDKAGNDNAKDGDSKEKIVLKFAVSQPTTHSLSTETFVPFMERVTELTDGQVEFDYYPAEQLGKLSDLLDLTGDGVTDIGMYMSTLTPSKMPLSNGLLTMPGMYSTALEGSMAFHELSKKSPVLESDFLNNGVRPLVGYAIPVYEYWTTGKQIITPADLKGMKVRATGDLANKALKDLGGSAVNINVAEMYEALERGVIDSVSLYAASMKDYGMAELIKFGTNGVAFGGSGIGLIINEKTFEGLPENVQEVLVQVGDEFTESNAKFFDEYNLSTIEAFREAGINVHDLTDGEKEVWNKYYAKMKVDFLKEQTNPDMEAIMDEFEEGIKRIE